MKPILILALFLSSISLFAQTEQDIGKIVIGVKVPDNANNETCQLSEVLEKKLLSLCAQGGFSSFSNYYFYLSPSIVIESTDIAEGGMKNVYIVKGNLYLTIQDGSTVYSSTSIPFKGTATSESKALKNAITALEYKDFQTILQKSKEKIHEYFISHKSSIFAKADAYYQINQYDEAITTLLMIPEDLSDMYQEAVEKASSIYEQKCKYEQEVQIAQIHESNDAILVRASSLLAEHNPEAALSVLSDYQESDAVQNKRFNSLLAKAESQVSANERRSAALARQQHQDQMRREAMTYNLALKGVELQKHRINAMKTVACTYLRNNPSFRYYYYVSY